MRYDHKQEKPADVFTDIVRVMAALRNEEPHYGSRQPANDMKRKYIPHMLKSRKERLRQVVDRHCTDGNQLYLI